MTLQEFIKKHHQTPMVLNGKQIDELKAVIAARNAKFDRTSFDDFKSGRISEYNDDTIAFYDEHPDAYTQIVKYIHHRQRRKIPIAYEEVTLTEESVEILNKQILYQGCDAKRVELCDEMNKFLLRCTHKEFANCVEFVLDKAKADKFREIAIKDGCYIRPGRDL